MKNFLRVQIMALTRYLKRSSIMSKRSESCPCLCEISKHILVLARTAGILPIRSLPGKGVRGCSFATSNYVIAYSVVLQIVYFAYFFFVYSIRWYCSQDKSYKDTDWYLMTMGYFITDLDSMVTLLIGVMRSKRVCRILEKLSKLDSSIAKDKELKTNVTRVTWLVLLYLGVKIGSFLHSALFLSTFKSGLFSMSCSCLGSPIAVLVRGITVVFPTVEIAIVYMFVVLVEAKFEYLAESVAITIENMGGEKDSCGLIYIKTPTAKKETQVKKEDISEKSLDRLAVMHLEIFSVVSEINYCTGFQLLIGHCSSLYTMIYYLYRYITFTIDRYTTRSSRLYYVPSLFYRLVKIIGYMILGQRFHTKSLLPLKTLQRIRITNLPSHVQQQIQTLMMQWNDKKAYLTAWGIVNFGPWLLAPIAGNIITYLLVALQFDDTSIEDTNATLIMQSMI